MATAGDTQANLIQCLPPINLLGFRRTVSNKTVLTWHFAILLALYSVFLLISYLEGTLYVRGGIGVLQNPPFFGHLIAGGTSIPLIVVLAWRIVSTKQTHSAAVARSLAAILRTRRLPLALYAIAASVGLIALANTLVLASSYTIDIYDAVHHTSGLIAYTAIRTYDYLACYPFAISASFALVYFYFSALRNGSSRFEPFHADGLGGYRGDLRAFDQPIFGLLLLTLLIPIANYIGWGGFSTVPVILAVLAPTIAFGLGIFLYASFSATIASKRKEEVERLRAAQQALFTRAGAGTPEGETKLSEVIGEIESIERLIEIVNRRRSIAWVKYVVAYAPVLLSKLPYGTILGSLHLPQFVQP